MLKAREDLIGLRKGQRRHQALATPNLDITYVHDADRVLAFHRWKGPEYYLVVATFSDNAWPGGYRVPSPKLSGGRWREIFTSDAVGFGRTGIGNAGELPVVDDHIEPKLPARGFIVIRYVPNH